MGKDGNLNSPILILRQLLQASELPSTFPRPVRLKSQCDCLVKTEGPTFENMFTSKPSTLSSRITIIAEWWLCLSDHAMYLLPSPFIIPTEKTKILESQVNRMLKLTSYYNSEEQIQIPNPPTGKNIYPQKLPITAK